MLGVTSAILDWYEHLAHHLNEKKNKFNVKYIENWEKDYVRLKAEQLPASDWHNDF